MLRRLFRICLLLVLLAAVAGACWFVQSADPRYDATELICWRRYHRYDALIEDVAKRRQLDPMLVKALIWRESRFHPNKLGTSGERGLMQLGVAAASEWAKAEHQGVFTPDDLFDPKRNLEAGTWLLARALRRWQSNTAEDPLSLALAEYNAGHSRVQRWAAAASIGFPATRQYVQTIEHRYHFYQKRGRL